MRCALGRPSSGGGGSKARRRVRRDRQYRARETLTQVFVLTRAQGAFAGQLGETPATTGDFTYVATGKGFVHVAFVIDAYAGKIVGWRVSTSAHVGFVLDALKQAVHERRPAKGMGLVHHSDRGAQYLSSRYSERLAESGIEPSVGRVGDSYDNALAETLNGLFKAEVIHRRGPWRNLQAVEYATLERVDWFNNRQRNALTLFEPIGTIPPAEAEANFHAAREHLALAA